MSDLRERFEELLAMRHTASVKWATLPMEQAREAANVVDATGDGLRTLFNEALEDRERLADWSGRARCYLEDEVRGVADPCFRGANGLISEWFIIDTAIQKEKEDEEDDKGADVQGAPKPTEADSESFEQARVGDVGELHQRQAVGDSQGGGKAVATPPESGQPDLCATCGRHYSNGGNTCPIEPTRPVTECGQHIAGKAPDVVKELDRLLIEHESRCYERDFVEFRNSEPRKRTNDACAETRGRIQSLFAQSVASSKAEIERLRAIAENEQAWIAAFGPDPDKARSLYLHPNEVEKFVLQARIETLEGVVEHLSKKAIPDAFTRVSALIDHFREEIAQMKGQEDGPEDGEDQGVGVHVGRSSVGFAPDGRQVQPEGPQGDMADRQPTEEASIHAEGDGEAVAPTRYADDPKEKLVAWAKYLNADIGEEIRRRLDRGERAERELKADRDGA